MGFHGYYFNTVGSWLTHKYPHCYVAVEGDVGGDVNWGRYTKKSTLDVNWGRYTKKSTLDVNWGSYGEDVMNIVVPTDGFDISADGKFIVEKQWHKLEGIKSNYNFYLVDASDRLMNNPSYVIDIWYKLITTADLIGEGKGTNYDLMTTGYRGFNYTGWITTYWASQSLGGSPTMQMEAGQNAVQYCACVTGDNPSNYIMALPSKDELGYIEGLPIGSIINNLGEPYKWTSHFEYRYTFGSPWDYGVFLGASSRHTETTAFLQGINKNDAGVEYTVDPSKKGIGFPIQQNYYNNKYIMPNLFEGFYMCDARNIQNRVGPYGFTYFCLGVHKI